MAQKIMYAKSRVDGDAKSIIYCKDLDRGEYETRYRGNLSCIKGCRARIKFTERKNNMKFFSTWNKEGNLHDKTCPYHVDYKGKIGRKRLVAFYKGIELSEDDILRRLQDKMERLNNIYSEQDIIDPINGSLEVDISGESDVAVYVDDDNGDKSEFAPRIRYDYAEFISADDIGCRKGVLGYIRNVKLEEDKNKVKYAYFNLTAKHSNVSIAFSEAFYSNELSQGVEEFERYIMKVNEMVEKGNKVYVIAYGEITRKRRDKNGVNVLVISPYRILVNGMTYRQIVYAG